MRTLRQSLRQIALLPRRTGGAALVTVFTAAGGGVGALSAALRARMAFSASPGLETLERSNFGSALAADLAADGRPFVPPR